MTLHSCLYSVLECRWNACFGIHDTICVAHQSCCLSTSHHSALRNWNIFHGMVLCVSLYFIKFCSHRFNFVTMLMCFPIERLCEHIYSFMHNNNNRVYTPLSEKCSQSRVFISPCHMNHIIQYYAY